MCSCNTSPSPYASINPSHSQAVHPECVVVELCRSRTALLADTRPQQPQQPQPQQQQQQQQGRDTAADGSFSEDEERQQQQQQQQQQQRVASNSQASSSSGSPALSPPPSQQQQQPKQSNPLGLSGSTNFVEVMMRTLSQGGQSGLVLRLLLAGQARRAAGELRDAWGGWGT